MGNSFIPKDIPFIAQRLVNIVCSDDIELCTFVPRTHYVYLGPFTLRCHAVTFTSVHREKTTPRTSVFA